MSKPQRRKGNAKAASSARAAELLAVSGNPLSFIGIDGCYVATEDTEEDIGSEIDSEIVVIFKKLTKKDPQTREKAIRELIEVVPSRDVTMNRYCFSYLSTILVKLCLDGSSSVRSLSIRLAEAYVLALKKDAEKFLPNVLPVIMFSRFDTTNSVSNNARSFFTSCFSVDKVDKVIGLFHNDALKLALDIALNKSPYLIAQKYDDEESCEQREGRLVVQALQSLLNACQMMDESLKPKTVDVLKELFQDVTSLKRLLKSPHNQVLACLLQISVQVKSDLGKIIIDSPILPFCLKCLDSSHSSLAKSSFEVLVTYFPEDRDNDYLNVKKSVIPRILSIVRKKTSLYESCGIYFLPIFAKLCSFLSEEDKPGFITSFVASFIDNLPFTNSSAIVPWIGSFCECCKYGLTHFYSESIISSAIENLLSVLEYNDLYQLEEALNRLAEYVLWLSERDQLNEVHWNHLCNFLQLNLVKKRPLTDKFIVRLTSFCTDKTLLLHIGVLRSPPMLAESLRCLSTCSSKYFSAICKEFNIVEEITSNINNFPTDSHDYLAQVVYRAIQENKENAKLVFKSDLSFQKLVFSAAACNEEQFKVYYDIINENQTDAVAYIAHFIYEWMIDDVSEQCILFLPSLTLEIREQVLNLVLDDAKSEHAPFIAQCCRFVKWTDSMLKRFSRFILYSVFDVWIHFNEKQLDYMIETITLFKPSESLINGFIPNFLDSIGGYCEVRKRTIESLLEEDAIKIAHIVNKLVEKDVIFESVLIRDDSLYATLYEADDNFMAWMMPYYVGIFESAGGDEPKLSVSRLDELIRTTVHRTWIYSNVDLQELRHKTKSNILAVLAASNVIAKVASTLEFSHESEELSVEDIQKHTYQKIVEISNGPSLAGECLLSENLQSPTVVMTLRFLYDEFKIECKDSTVEMSAESLSSIRVLSSKREDVDSWISRYHSRHYGSRLSVYLEKLREYSWKYETRWENSLFSFSSETDIWKLNITCLHASIEVVQCRESVSDECWDLISCGLITALQSCVEASVTKEMFVSQKFTTFLALTMDLFTSLAKFIENEEDKESNFVKDWDSFFAPAAGRSVLVLWITMMKESDVFLQKRVCHAVSLVNEYPEDLECPQQFVPELDGLRYEPKFQSMISACMNGLKSDVPLLQFTALYWLKKITPTMYIHENGEWKDDEDEIPSGPLKRVVPFVLSDILHQESVGRLSFMAMYAALTPFESGRFSDEERVAYSDTFAPIVSNVLPSLISNCPDEQYVVSHGKESLFVENFDYFDGKTSEHLAYFHFNSHLLYRILKTLPAIVRTWYNGLPSNAASIVNKYISKFCSASLINEELNKVRQSNKEQTKKDLLFNIRVVPAASEVVAKYTVEETTMVLTIAMPKNWPLSVPLISLDKSIVASERSKKWLLQLTAYLFHQNGSTVEGILMWRRNVDKDVDGAEACTICMMTIHSNSHQLPKVKCKQCKNKFHSNCLYKWFESSNQSSCPLCRSNFT